MLTPLTAVTGVRAPDLSTGGIRSAQCGPVDVVKKVYAINWKWCREKLAPSRAFLPPPPALFLWRTMK